YLQSGQEAIAREVIEHTDHVVGADEESKAEHRAYFTARTALELHRWKEAAALPVPATRKDWLDTIYWARAIGAARSGDVAGARNARGHALRTQAFRRCPRRIQNRPEEFAKPLRWPSGRRSLRASHRRCRRRAVVLRQARRNLRSRSRPAGAQRSKNLSRPEIEISPEFLHRSEPQGCR